MSEAAEPDVESSSEGYARRFAGRAGQMFLERQEHCVAAALADKRTVRILDVGGGHAQLASPLAELGHAVTVTGSDAACSARLTLEPRGGGVTFLKAPLAALPLADRSFDTVVSIRTMAHVADWRSFLGEMCRVAERTVVIDYPDLVSVNALSLVTYPLKRRIEGDTRRFRILRRAEIESVLRANGFAETWRSGQMVLPMALHRAAHGAAPLRWVESAAQRIGLARRCGNPAILRADRVD
ncbi:class I SAM-dependent methyltransferase [Sphingomonas koreensis]|nr:class I SAM-dependent methyltransferase [Sphingomonas koreensis]